MRKFTFSFKSLLVACGLLAGSANAWAQSIMEIYDFSAIAVEAGASINATFSGDAITQAGGQEVKLVSYGSYTLGNRFASSFSRKSGGVPTGQDWWIRNGNGWNCLLTYTGNSSTYYLSILDLLEGDKVTITLSNGALTLLSSNVVGLAANSNIVSGTQYTMSADGHLDFSGVGQSTRITKVVIEKVATVADAIADCKAHETSAAFATAVDAQSFADAAAVYAFHTAWQIAQAEAASSNDITKVIFDAGVSDFSRWNDARRSSGEQYTGAPDNKYFDGWYTEASNASQTIYGLPAGTYTLKVATRASAEVTDKSKYNVWVSGGTANVNVLGNHIGSTDGRLGHGWNWTVATFTLNAKANVSIGFYTKPLNSGDTKYWAGCDDWHLYKGDITVPVTITDAGYATFSSASNLDLTTANTPDGLTAYYIAESGLSKNNASFTTIDQTVAASEGVLFKGAAATYTVLTATSGTALSDNALVATNGSAIPAGNYVFAYENGTYANPGFYYVSSATAAVPAGKAYLDGSAVPSSVKSFIFGDDTATGVEAPVAAEAEEDGIYYNLNGQQVTKDYKGIVIVNGKKFFNK